MKVQLKTALWRNGVLRHEGEVIDLPAAEAKYLGHAVVPVVDAPAPVVEPAPEPVAEEAVAVEDEPVTNGGRYGRKR